MTLPNEYTLLILGNGFDLSLEIKSKYEDFYKNDKFKNSDSIWSYLIPILVPNAKVANWMDIESAISTVLTDESCGIFKNYASSNIEQIFPKFSAISPSYNLVWDSIKMDESSHYSKLPVDIQVLFLITANLLKKDKSQKLTQLVRDLERNPYSRVKDLKEQPLTKDSPDPIQIKQYEADMENKFYDFLSIVATFLLDELKLLESDFKDYLTEAVGDTNSYEEKASEKLVTLTKDCDSAYIDDSISQVEILNFNYTNLKRVSLRCEDGFDSASGERKTSEAQNLSYFKKMNIENIHGQLDKENIIFGIDSHDDQKVKSESLQLLAQPFTKSSRKLRITERKNFSIRSNYQNIVFFGHSLSDADYSYFKYIFDEVDLYSSNCHLIFKYATAYDAKNAHLIKAQICKNVEKLIRKYQETLPDNQQKDLFNRLLIQGRILVQDIDEETA